MTMADALAGEGMGVMLQYGGKRDTTKSSDTNEDIIKSAPCFAGALGISKRE
jgi:hypothetical protein